MQNRTSLLLRNIEEPAGSLAQADKLEATYKAMQDKFDILERLERHGDINDPVFLRAELQRNSFLLAH